MLFSRKTPAKWSEIIRIWLWPRRSWTRSTLYMIKRIMRLTASPHAVAAGVGAGVFASFTPFLGFHFLIAFLVAHIVAGNFIAAVMGTFFGNPISFPLIWTSTYKIGNFILAGKLAEPKQGSLSSLASYDVIEMGISGLWDRLIGLWTPLVKPMLIGAFPLGITFGIIAYIATRWAATVVHTARIKRLAKRAEAETGPGN